MSDAASLLDGGSLAESPIYFSESHLLAWVDMPAGAVHSVTVTETFDRVSSPTTRVIAPYLGAIVPALNGRIAALTVDSVVLLEEGSVRPLTRILTDPSQRLNDAACDLQGALWVGSTAVDGTPGQGALHKWDCVGEPVVVAEGLTQPNGIAWSPSGDMIYLVDTARHCVFASAVDRISLRTLIQFDDEEPDGLCVDSDGCLWIALWNGSQVRKYSPIGAPLDVIQLPVSRPTSCAFVGGGHLVVTSARRGLSDEAAASQPLAGHVLVLEAGAVGAKVGRLAV